MNLASRWAFAAVIAVAAAGRVVGQSTTRASVASSGVPGDGQSATASISADGRHVAFWSEATNLVSGDTNGTRDIFVRDLLGGVTTRVSVDSSGAQADGQSIHASISADGRYVAFQSLATNLVPADTNGFDDIFVHDLLSGVTTRASVDSSGAQGNNESHGRTSISADGRYVAFVSSATNLVPGDTNGREDVFVRDLLGGVTTRASVSSSSEEVNGSVQFPFIAAGGRYVAFLSFATNLVPGDTNANYDVFVRDLLGGVTTRASVGSAGEQGNNASYGPPSISADGRYVALESAATNFWFGDFNGCADIFVRDLQDGVTTRASLTSWGVGGNFTSYDPSISADGRYVAFVSESTNLVPGDTNGFLDVFVRDLLDGVTTRASVNASGVQADFASNEPSISADGRYVAFKSGATNLVAGDTQGWPDIFVRDWPLPPIVATCFGDGSGSACPCGNSGLAGHGCDNSVATGGAVLSVRGTRRLSEDTFVLTSSGELPSALGIFLQGSASVGPLIYGDGLRCVGGSLKRLYAKSALGGIASAPQAADPSVSARSAALGAPIPAGATRWYQVYYRDPNPSFCPNPPGNTWNVSNGIEAIWGF